jgi:hypothetical protein
VGETCSTHGGGQMYLHGFWLGCLKGRDHCKDLGIGGRIALQ